MSGQRVGERTRSEKIARTVAGLLCAPIVGALFPTCLAVGLKYLTTGDMAFVGPTSVTLTFALPIMFGVIIGWPIAFIIGWPIHADLLRKRNTSPPVYAGVGAALMVALVLLMGIGRPVWIDWAWLAFFATGGAVGGLIFWLIRRPDRDAPAKEPAA